MITNGIITGDCMEAMGLMPAASIDLIFADPPYNIGFKYDVHADNMSAEDYVGWFTRWGGECLRLLKPGGTFAVLIGDEFAAEFGCHLNHLMALGTLTRREWIVWTYTFGQNSKTQYVRSHAHMFICAKAGADRTFNRDEILVPSWRMLNGDKRCANGAGKTPDDTWGQRQIGDQIVDKGFARLVGNAKERVGWHPCQLPEAMLERVIKAHSNVGDVVFDPFTGSGTTLAVAARLGRRWAGCELSPDYAAKALARVRAAASTYRDMTPTEAPLFQHQESPNV